MLLVCHVNVLVNKIRSMVLPVIYLGEKFMLECDMCKEKITEEEKIGEIIGVHVLCKDCLALEKMAYEAYNLFSKSVEIMKKIPITPNCHMSWEEKMREWIDTEVEYS